MKRLRRAAAALLAMLGSACASTGGRAAPEPQWTTLRCSNCAREGIRVEVMPTVSDRGRDGTYLFARLANQNDYAVVVTVEFRAAVVPEDDGWVPRESWQLSLGSRASADAQSVFLLRRGDASVASVSRVERRPVLTSAR